MGRCYTCGRVMRRLPLTFFHCWGPQDMMDLRLRYFGVRQALCDACEATLLDVIYVGMRHGDLATIRGKKFWDTWKKNTREVQKDV